MAKSPQAPDLYEVHTLAAARLDASDQRYTNNRRLLVEVLAGALGPLTMAGILDGQDLMAQSSAYRNLTVLEEAGVVHRIVTSDDHARFELTETITGNHHHHLICDQCGDIVDVTLPPTLEAALDSSLTEEANRLGFVGNHHRVDLIGQCRRSYNSVDFPGRFDSPHQTDGMGYVDDPSTTKNVAVVKIQVSGQHIQLHSQCLRLFVTVFIN